VLVDHDAFRRVEPARRKDAVVYDTRGIWEQSRPPVRPALAARRESPPARRRSRAA
jgi:UDP-N-acetyl-D-mannosaminuronate dehydrogenase